MKHLSSSRVKSNRYPYFNSKEIQKAIITADVQMALCHINIARTQSKNIEIVYEPTTTAFSFDSIKQTKRRRVYQTIKRKKKKSRIPLVILLDKNRSIFSFLEKQIIIIEQNNSELIVFNEEKINLEERRQHFQK